MTWREPRLSPLPNSSRVLHDLHDPTRLSSPARRLLWVIGLVLILFSANGCDYFMAEWMVPPTSVYLDPRPTFTPTQSDVTFWATTVGEILQEPTATPEPLADLCALLPQEPNREVTSNRANRACWADYYERLGEPHSWIGGIKLDKQETSTVAKEVLEKGLDEGWEWRPVEGFGERAYEFHTGKAIAYHLRYHRGPFTIQIQAKEGQEDLLRDLAEQVNEQIRITLEQ